MPAPSTSPPYVPSRFTDPTRPCSPVGTARWRTVSEVVPQMNACAPKTKNTGSATYGDEVDASARWVRVSMTRPTRISPPRLIRRVSQPYETVPSRPPAAETVVISPKPTLPSPRCSVA